MQVDGIPYQKDGEGFKRVKRQGPAEIAEALQRHMAVRAIAEDCGLEGVLPRTWVEQVDAIAPGLG